MNWDESAYRKFVEEMRGIPANFRPAVYEALANAVKQFKDKMPAFPDSFVGTFTVEDTGWLRRKP